MYPGDDLKTATRYDPWDAVVLGAGPAGAIAARQLAQPGCRVLLVEKSRVPRSKVCGGCIGGAALDVLDSVGLGGLPVECGGKQLRWMCLASGNSIAQIEVGRRIAVSRRTFDAALVREAICAGAFFCAETAGRLPRESGGDTRSVALCQHEKSVTVRARVVIVATGVSRCPNGFVARASSTSLIGLGIVLDNCGVCEPDTLYMACGAAGYVGIAPVEDAQVDIAAAVDRRALAASASPGKLIAEILAGAGLPMFAYVEHADFQGTPPFTRQTRPLGSNRCLLVGDAAGYVEPFTGEGIGWAMQSAVLACSLLTGRLEQWDPELPDRWADLYERALGRHQRKCRFITKMLRSKSIREVVLWSLHRAPSLAGPVIRQLEHFR